MKDVADVMIIVTAEVPLDIRKIKKALIYQKLNLKNELAVTYLVPDEFKEQLNEACQTIDRPAAEDEVIAIDTHEELAQYHSKDYLLFTAKLIISPVTRCIAAIIPDDISEYMTALELVADVIKGKPLGPLN